MGRDPSNWAISHDVSAALACVDSKVLDFPLFVPVGDRASDIIIQSATAAIDNDNSDGDVPAGVMALSGWLNRTTNLSIIRGADDHEGGLAGQLSTAASHLSGYLAGADSGEDSIVALYQRFGKSVIGIYLGSRVHKQIVAQDALSLFTKFGHLNRQMGSVAMENCGTGIPGGEVLGIVSDSNGGIDGLAKVQEVVRGWHAGRCVHDSNVEATATVSQSEPIKLWWRKQQLLLPDQVGSWRSNDTSNSTFSARSSKELSTDIIWREPAAASACVELKAEADNNCGNLTKTCGLGSLDDLWAGKPRRLLQLQQRHRMHTVENWTACLPLVRRPRQSEEKTKRRWNLRGLHRGERGYVR